MWPVHRVPPPRPVIAGLTGKLSLLEAQTAALEYCASDAAHGHGAAVGALFGAPSPDDREGLDEGMRRRG